ncbi:MAG: esterase-like activity of phytase family protein [Hyphomonadaceae bacterium]|nr:esterase-like activity of phytase family protein [Hyphomonadaceae bacterium]
MMHIALIRRTLVAAAALFAAAAVAQPPPEPSPPPADPIGDLIESVPAPRPPQAIKPVTLDGYFGSLRSRSCPSSAKPVEAEGITLTTKSVSLQAMNPMRTSVGGLNLVAGYDLTSEDERFGGLSGIDILDDGNLIAVTDKGDFVWIDLQDDGLTPAAMRIAPMRDGKGKPFPTKGAADAEGLAIRDGLALVSFESNARVLAYDIGACGAAARGIPLGWDMGAAFARQKLNVGDNQGVEGLAITNDWYLLAGVETKLGNASPLSARPLEAAARFDLTLGENAPELVGLDQLQSGEDTRVFSLHRSSRPLSGNAITVVETVLQRDRDQSNLPARIGSELHERSRQYFLIKSSRVLAEMNLLVTIDNYEGIAAKRMPDGRVRLFIVSDDNYSATQRTLLMVFDVK